jgi:hypothetical protein
MTTAFDKHAFAARINSLVSYAFCNAEVKPELADATRQILFERPRSEEQVDAYVRLMTQALGCYCGDQDADVLKMRAEIRTAGMISWWSFVAMMYHASEACFEPGHEKLQNGIYLAFSRAGVLDKYEAFERGMQSLDRDEHEESRLLSLPPEITLAYDMGQKRLSLPKLDHGPHGLQRLKE